jgi:hypothetical protein
MRGTRAQVVAGGSGPQWAGAGRPRQEEQGQTWRFLGGVHRAVPGPRRKAPGTQ